MPELVGDLARRPLLGDVQASQFARRPSPTGYSTTSAPSRRIVPVSASGRGSAGSSVVTPSRCASGSNVVPWSSVETSDREEDDVEELEAVRDALDHREGREHHRDRAAQPGPAEHDPLAAREAPKPRVATNVADRARDEHEHEREQRALDATSPSWHGKTSSPSVEEQRDLGHPGEALVEGGDRALGGDCGAAEHQPGQVDGEEARAVQRRRRAP